MLMLERLQRVTKSENGSRLERSSLVRIAGLVGAGGWPGFGRLWGLFDILPRLKAGDSN